MDMIAKAPYRMRHENGRREATVVFVEPVTPHLRRITFHSPDFCSFTSGAADDHVKLFFPEPGGAQVMRDYTPRRFDNEACELTIEFVLHETGPASDWAARAKPGDKMTIGGPRGSLIVPDMYDAYVLLGDETALPAIARRLEELPETAKAIVYIDVADAGEERKLESKAQLDITWLKRDGRPAGRAGLLEAAAETLQLPEGEVYVWVAAEIEVARRLRTYFTEEEGLPRSQVKAAGYWKIGEAGAHEKLD